MYLERKYFPDVISDNEEMYFLHLQAVIESVDELAILQVTKLADEYNFRLSPSIPMYNNMLIEELLKFHNVFHIHMELSKSIKSSGVLNFKIRI